MSSKAYATLTITDVEDGVGVDTITYTYATTTTQTAPPESSITSTTIPTLTSTNKYLWRKEVVTYTDSTKPAKTTVSLIAVYGDDGLGVSKITPLYYCSNSKALPSKPESIDDVVDDVSVYNKWNKQIPKWSNEYRYYFTCNEILYDDNVTRYWTDPVFNNALTDAYDINVGTRNYARNTGDLSKWYHTSTVANSSFNNSEIHFSHGSEQNWDYQICMNPRISYDLLKGQEVTLSFSVKCDKASAVGDARVTISSSTSPVADSSRDAYNNVYRKAVTDLSTEWQRESVTFTINDSFFNNQISSHNTNYLFIQVYNYSTCDIWYKDIKLELGNHATDWNIAPEDVTSYIDGNEKWKTEVEFKISDEGIKSTVSGSLNVGGRNLIRNSETLEFADYYFDGSVVATQSENQTTVRGVANAYQTNNTVRVM